MKIRLFLTFISCIIAFVAVGGNVAVVPKPAVLIYNDGEYRFSPMTTYSVPDYPGDSVAMVMDMIKDDLQKGAGTTLSAVHDNAALSLRTDSTLASEGYALDVTPEGITIRAARPAGFFYALQSLRQLLPFSFTPSATAAVIPCVSIMDTPMSGWRGFMLDEGRHFFGKEEVKRVLDIMATYKMNRFHWHLADDQGWRIEIKKYPLLTEVGAWRGSKTLGWDKLKPDTLTYGGYYTQDDIREIVAYAADRFIEIVPEIDIPGHSMAAIAAYPDQLACDPENPHGVWVMQGISADAIYQTATVNIRHTLSFGRSGLPHDDKTSHVVYTDALFPSSDADSRESSVSTMPSVSARYLFILPKNNVVTVNWNMGYSHTTRSLLYRLGQLDPIANDNRDNTYTPSANIYYTKKLGHNNTFRAAISTSNSISDTHYSGSYDGLQRVRTSDNQLLGEYSQNWSNGLSLFSRAGVTYTLDRVNGVNTLNQWNPLLGVQLQYYINQKHMASASAWWTSGSPAASSANSALVQSNELLWLMGNPDLRGTSNRQVSLSYYFIPTNVFSLSVYGKYDDTDRNLVYEYMTLPGYDGLVRRTINSGSRNTWTGDLSATLRLLRNSLVVNGGVSAQRVVLTGIDAQSHNTLIPRIYASYMTGHFAFSANFSSGGTSINSSPLNRRFKNPCTYGVQVTYAVGEF